MERAMLIGAIIIGAVFLVSLIQRGVLTGGQPGSAKISPQEAKKKMQENKKIQLIDVRTKAEYDLGHIKGAVSIPLDTMGAQPPKKLSAKDAEIIVYCQSGSRSRIAAKKLVGFGYTNILDMGGLMRWPYGLVK